jgi:hypothetical protein
VLLMQHLAHGMLAGKQGQPAAQQPDRTCTFLRLPTAGVTAASTTSLGQGLSPGWLLRLLIFPT